MDEIEVSVNEYQSVRTAGDRDKGRWSAGRPVDLDEADEVEQWRSSPRRPKVVDLDEMVPPSTTMTTLEDSAASKDGQGETSSLVDLDVSPESSINEDDDGRDKYAVVDVTFETSTEEDEDDDKPKSKKDGRCVKYVTTRNIIYAIIILILVIGGSVVLALFKRGRLDGAKDRLDDIYADLENNGETGPAMLCNGLESNCDWRIPEVMFASVHNAMSSREDGFVEWNNLFPLEDALEAGFRGLFLDVCDCPILGVHLCHTLCSGGYRRPIQVFENILSFLRENTGEVVILELQIIDLSLSPLWNVLSANVPELMDIMYAHPNSSVPWPYMRDLITSNKRLIVFQHDGPDCDIPGQCPHGIHNTYRYGFETPYDSQGVEELMNTNRTCVASRGDAFRPFMISNHFASDRIRLPDYNIALEANQAHNIINRMEDCREVQGRLPSMLVVDFWSAGDVVATVQKYNEERGFRTHAPSSVPSSTPSAMPSLAPTTSPSTATPSESPSVVPTMSPTFASDSPSRLPSLSPSAWPSTSPSSLPTTLPSSATSSPSEFIPPSPVPTTQPSTAMSPTTIPTSRSPSSSLSPPPTTTTATSPITEPPTATPSSTTQSPFLTAAMTPPPTSQDELVALTGDAMTPPPSGQTAGTTDYRSYLAANETAP